MTHGSLQEHVYDHIANMFFLHQGSLWLDGFARVLLSGKKSYLQSVNPKAELNEDDDLVLIVILCIFTFDNFYHLLKDIFGWFLCFRKVIFRE
jgi:hypothetical protein